MTATKTDTTERSGLEDATRRMRTPKATLTKSGVLGAMRKEATKRSNARRMGAKGVSTNKRTVIGEEVMDASQGGVVT